MGLTSTSTGSNMTDSLRFQAKLSGEFRFALAGNPNVGKSTVFNGLTGMRQHTGNWPGKTVALTDGKCSVNGRECILVDLPGTYSLMSHSPEEDAARDYICFGDVDAVIVVCDATCLERNLNLALQVMELCSHVLICVNLLDEAEKKGICIDLERLSQTLHAPVVGVTARDKRSLAPLLPAAIRCAETMRSASAQIPYPQEILAATKGLRELLRSTFLLEDEYAQWLSFRVLEGDENVLKSFFTEKKHSAQLSEDLLKKEIRDASKELASVGINDSETLDRRIVESILARAEAAAGESVRKENGAYARRDWDVDRILTSRMTGYPIMVFLLSLLLWITVKGANYPSQLLSHFLFWLGDRLSALLLQIGTARWLHDALILGVYRVLAWVVSVMLPPMAIFFPLFTLLEDAGVLPRIAFNLDKPFHRCQACGKQALTMAMGFGCNAAGIVGCRIIDSPRERLMAILTNCFVPCNGRFPILISLLTMFFVSSSLLTAVLLTGLMLLGVAATFTATKLLSVTVLRGEPSSFTLELPPYRCPQIGQVLVRSLLDRTLFVLGRSASVAAPAGLVLWLLANISPEGVSLLQRCADILQPFGRMLGMDGAILLAFILGFPANETVIPILLMVYLAQGSLSDGRSVAEIHTILLSHGWTWTTAVSVLLFTLMHWPCSTTLITAYRETKSAKWTALTALLPTVSGFLVCMMFHGVTVLLGF